MKAIGIKINIQNYDANTFFGTNLPERHVPDRRVRLGVDAVRVGQPVHLLLVHQRRQLRAELDPLRPTRRSTAAWPSGSAATSQSQETTDFNKADTILWQNMVTLPLYQKPQFFAWSNTLRACSRTRRASGVTVERQALGPEGLARSGDADAGDGPASTGVPRPSAPPGAAPRLRPCSPTSSDAWSSAIVILFFATILVFLLVAESGDPLALLKRQPPHPPLDHRRPRERCSTSTTRCGSATGSGSPTPSTGTSARPSTVRTSAPRSMSHLFVTLRMVIVATCSPSCRHLHRRAGRRAPGQGRPTTSSP